MKKIWRTLGAFCLIFGFFFVLPLNGSAAEDDIAGGVIKESYGEILWRIDKNGHLTVEGWGDFSKDSMANYTSHNRIPWYDYRKEIYSAEIKVEKMKNASWLFAGCIYINHIDLTNFPTNEITHMQYMFYDCKNLKQIDVSSFDTSQVQNMKAMFSGCENLKQIDVSSFDTSQVQTMNAMFCNCHDLKNLDVSNFDTSHVTDMGYMFYNCLVLEKLDVSNFNTELVQKMDAMFCNCKNLEELDVSGYDTGNVVTTSSMFSNCILLKTLDVSSFHLEKVYDIDYMFYGCGNLKELDVSNFNVKPKSAKSVFNNCFDLIYLNLSTFHLPDLSTEDFFLSGCNRLNTIETPLNESMRIPLPSGYNDESAWYSSNGVHYKVLPCSMTSMTLFRLNHDEFLDVYPEEWYAPYVKYVADKHLMNGNRPYFSPNDSMTRAMVVQTLYNMEGKPTVTDYKACLELKDVYVDWYTDAVAWAYNEGITTGYDDTKTFEVNKSVTREELAAFLYRYANYKGYDTIQEGDFSGLQNIDKVAPYAKDAMSWAVGAGLISGIEIKQDGAIVARDLSPQGTATRAQMAAILQRFCIAYAEPVIFEWNGHSYTIYDNCQSWDGARAYCEAKGGHLAVIDSAEENEALYNFIKENGYTSAYFGLSDTTEEGSWRWVTGEEASYTNWNELEPSGGTNENYAMFFYLYEDGTWNDGVFSENVHDGGNAYICEWE